MFKKVLIANRGEIAVRVIRACREMGIATVAMFSDADRDALHVSHADEAYRLGPATATESYLSIPRILDVARRAGAQAIHPGYGFLSENSRFARACAEAGVKFIGPPPTAMELMGSKTRARQAMQAAGVPMVPGSARGLSADEAVELAARIGFPVMIKAAAGGGGKGIRIVGARTEFEAAAESARREAEKAFGNGTLLLEKYVEGARHVEFQILGDAHGNLVHLFERDCSIQRRHQKIIEESPSPALTPELRRKMGEAAIAVARAIGYSNAGTVEFILGPSGQFYFIEVNTRLQVEHPVTEMITGMDLVKLQIEVAEGKPLSLVQDQITSSGHAMEARLYAERPGNDFLPSTGVIADWTAPAGIDELRVDSGVETGSAIGIFYDPMLAKVIAWASDRDAAVRKLAYALNCISVQGLNTNREFLIKILEHPEFTSGAYDTSFVPTHLQDLVATFEGREPAAVAVVALYLLKTRQFGLGVLRDIPPNYRNNPFRDPSIKFSVRDDKLELSYRCLGDDDYIVSTGDWRARARILSFGPGSIRIEFDRVQFTYRVVESGDDFFVHSFSGSERVTRLDKYPAQPGGSSDESANSPMPGQVIKVLVQEGQDVAAGDPLVILEAMKMEQIIRATLDGVVHEILVKAGDVVTPGEILIQIGRTSQSE